MVTVSLVDFWFLVLGTCGLAAVVVIILKLIERDHSRSEEIRQRPVLGDAVVINPVNAYQGEGDIAGNDFAGVPVGDEGWAPAEANIQTSNINEEASKGRMTKKMLRKAENKRLKNQRKLDMAAWIQAKKEQELIRQERYRERYGDSDSYSNESDISDNSGDEKNIIEQVSKPLRINDYRHYVPLFPQILEFVQNVRVVDLQNMRSQYNILTLDMCKDIIKHFETAGWITGVFVSDGTLYCRLDDQVQKIAQSLNNKISFNALDLEALLNEIVAR